MIRSTSGAGFTRWPATCASTSSAGGSATCAWRTQKRTTATFWRACPPRLAVSTRSRSRNRTSFAGRSGQYPSGCLKNTGWYSHFVSSKDSAIAASPRCSKCPRAPWRPFSTGPGCASKRSSSPWRRRVTSTTTRSFHSWRHTWPESCGGSRRRPSGGMWRSAPDARARSEGGRFAGRAPNEGYNERRKMANVTVRFFDDETLEGTARDLDFDEPDFLVEVDDSAGLENNETAWIPMTAVKWVELPIDPDLASETPTRKVAIRFLHGEVLRGHLDGTLERHRYGVVLNLHGEHADSPIRKLGIPFSAVKALFFIREFDARGEEAGTASEAYLARRTMAPLLDVLEEMDMLARLHRDGLLSDDEFASKRTQVLERL